MGYKATLSVNCQKLHECVRCDALFSYVLSRQVEAEGPTERKAEKAAYKQAVSTLETDIEVFECPGCGCVQPDMVADSMKGSAFLAAIVAIVGFIVALILGGTRATHISTSAYVAAASAGVGVLLFALAGLHNPNRDLAANKRKGEDNLDGGKVSLDRRGDDPGPYGPAGASAGLGGKVGLLLALASVPAAAAPVILTAARGLPANDTYPAVFSPGDEEVRVYFDSEIECVKGMWRGTVRATVRPAEGGGKPMRVVAKTSSDSWGNSISGKSSELSNSSKTMWADVTFPERDGLAGRPLKLDLVADVQYPHRRGDGFDVLNKQLRHTADIELAPIGSGSLFYLSWWGGQVAAIGLCTTAWLVMFITAKGLQAKAKPTQVRPLRGEEGEDQAED